jgi:tetratricopeptide (TPR) repeat protein
MEGMGLRLVPEKRKQGEEFVNAEMLHKQLFNSPEVPSRDYRPGFLFRGLNDKRIFFDENHLRMTQNFRNGFMRLAIYYVNSGQKELAMQTLDRMESKMPRSILPLDFGLLYEIANIYLNAGGRKQYEAIVPEIEEKGWAMIEENPTDVQSYWNPYRILLDTYENTGNNRKLLDVWQKLETLFPNDQNVKSNVQKYKAIISGGAGSVPPDTMK